MTLLLMSIKRLESDIEYESLVMESHVMRVNFRRRMFCENVI